MFWGKFTFYLMSQSVIRVRDLAEWTQRGRWKDQWQRRKTEEAEGAEGLKERGQVQP
jgi:hypothetical protein